MNKETDEPNSPINLPIEEAVDRHFGISHITLARIARADFSLSFDQHSDNMAALAKFIESNLKKALYAIFLDSLAIDAYPQEKINSKRFTSFIANFCSWPDCNRVSLPHLVALLRQTKDEKYETLKEFIASLASPFVEQERVTLDHDPHLNDILTIWPKGKRGPEGLCGYFPKQLSHAYLFYYYRNSLIHEMRSPGISMEKPEDNTPFYVNTSKLTPFIAPDWFLVYPLGFFYDMCAKALDNLNSHFIKSNCHPSSISAAWDRLLFPYFVERR